jgi:hypothetical protein
MKRMRGWLKISGIYGVGVEEFTDLPVLLLNFVLREYVVERTGWRVSCGKMG